MKLEINSLTQVLADVLTSIKRREFINEYGEPYSEYYVIAWDEDGSDLSVSVTESRTNGDEWYSVHVIDDIAGRDGQIINTDHISELELLKIFSEQLTITLDDLIEGRLRRNCGFMSNKEDF